MEKRNLTHSKGFFIRVDDEFEEALEALRKAEVGIPSKAEVVRRLVMQSAAKMQRKPK